MTKLYLITDGEHSDYGIQHVVEGPDDLPELLRLAKINLDSFVKDCRAASIAAWKDDPPKPWGSMIATERNAWLAEKQEREKLRVNNAREQEAKYAREQRAFFEANYPGQPFNLLGVLQGLGCKILEWNEVNLDFQFIRQTDSENRSVQC